jgi:hypothetical protein
MFTFFKNQMKTQVFELIDSRRFESMLFHYSITQDNVVDISSSQVQVKLGITCMQMSYQGDDPS